LGSKPVSAAAGCLAVAAKRSSNMYEYVQILLVAGASIGRRNLAAWMRLPNTRPANRILIRTPTEYVFSALNLMSLKQTHLKDILIYAFKNRHNFAHANSGRFTRSLLQHTCYIAPNYN